MNFLIKYWEMSQLAQAAYVDLSNETDDAVIARLRSPPSPNEAFAFSSTQSSRLIGIDGFKVVDISDNLNDSFGFSATLFQDNRTGDYSLAIRGTEPTTASDLAYSITEISLWGIAAHQTISLYNYFQRLITPIGESVKQLSIEDLDHAPTDGRLYVTMPRLGTSGPFEDPDGGVIYLAIDSYYADNAIGVLANKEDVKLNVTGHSLGGELSQALERLFPNWMDDVYAYNTAGFYPGNADPFFHLIDSSVGNFDQEKIHNIYSYNGLEFITNTLVHTQYGERIGVLIEDQFPTLSGNHSIVLQGRSLALHALFEKIDPLFEPSSGEEGAPAFPKIDALIRSGSYNQPTTYEATLGSLIRLFLNENVSLDDLEDLETFYAKLYAIRDVIGSDSSSLTIESLLEKSSDDIIRAATSGDPTNSTAIAYRYALYELNPFVVIGVDYQATHNSHGELDLFKPDDGTGALSDKWIEDRAAMLVAFNEARATDAVRAESQLSASTGGIIFNGYDGAGTSFSILPSGNPFGIRRLITFDNDQAHEITGQMKDDHLYGGGGDDVISGADGVDWLEGEDGNDILYGGNGGDWLYGGKGDDRLDGDGGTNVLNGGFGFDTYVYDISNGGFDFIQDNDGRVLVDGIAVTGGKRLDESVYISADRRNGYRLEGTTLIIDGTVAVLDFQNGDLGIELDDALDVEDDLDAATTGQVFASLNSQYVVGSPGADIVREGGSASGSQILVAGSGNDVLLVQPSMYNVVEGGSGADYIVGSGIKDILGGDFLAGQALSYYGEMHVINNYSWLDETLDSIELTIWDGFEQDSFDAHFSSLGYFEFPEAAKLVLGVGGSTDLSTFWNDVIEGGGGNDQINGEIGSDRLFGQDGDDLLEDGGKARIIGSSGFDYELTKLEAQASDADYIDGGDGDDVLRSSSGQDWVVGGAGSDLISGGAIVDGGAGADVLLRASPGGKKYVGAVLSGGDGDDIIWAGNGAIVDGGAGEDIIVISVSDIQNGKSVSIKDSDGASRFIFDTADSITPSVPVTFARRESDLLVYYRPGNFRVSVITWTDWFSNPDSGADLTYLGGFYGVGGGHGLTFWDFGEPVNSPFVPYYLVEAIASPIILSKQEVEEVARILVEATEMDDQITGNGRAEMIIGSEGDDTIDGAAGDDIVDGDVGTDNLFGGDGIDVVFGGEGDDHLDGGRGNDQMNGGNGNDVYVVDSSGDVVTELFNAGSDLVRSFLTYILPTNCENLTLIGSESINGIGNSLDNVIIGNSAGNFLDGRDGVDTLTGGMGQDTYMYGAGYGDDTILEGGAAGEIDLIQFTDGLESSDVSLTLEAGSLEISLLQTGERLVIVNWTTPTSRVERLVFSDLILDEVQLLAIFPFVANSNNAPIIVEPIADQNILGGVSYSFSVASTFSDSDPNDKLEYAAEQEDGGALPLWVIFDSDALSFSIAPDIYEINPISIRLSAQDTAGARVSDTFNIFVASPNLTISGTQNDDLLKGAGGEDQIHGLEGSDVIYGNAGADVLDGGDGTDTLIGGAGDDVLDGGRGIDILVGGLGDDTYVVDLADVVVESAEAGNDTLLVSMNYKLPINTENLVLTGVSAINGIGNTLDNVLRGDSAANVLMGLMGNDSYYVGAGDAVTEAMEGGIDSIYANVTWTLGLNLENLTLIGDATINGTGNALDNALTGNSAANVLTGRAGDDNYFVGNDDEVIEAIGEGIDTIYSSISWVLGNNLENLILTGNDEINGVGNAIANLMVGTIASNSLSGNEGNDILQGLDGDDSMVDVNGNTCFEGGAGTDTMTGNADNEMFIGGLGADLIATGIGANIVAFNLGDGQDVIGASAGADNTISLGGGIQYGHLTFSKSGSDLVLNTGGADKLTLANWYEEGVGKGVVNLQVIAEAMSGYNPVGDDAFLDNKVEQFDFRVFANEFDMAGQVSGWSLTNAMLSAHLTGSDTAAIGGDLAYQYGKNDALSGIGLTYAQDILNDPQFGSSAQTLRPIEYLQQGRIRLS